jgi:hypothetical protein
MNVAGIDLSTFHIDIVKIPVDGTSADWHRFTLNGADAFDRTRSVADYMPGRAHSFWDDTIAIGIEHPAGRHGVGAILRIQGAVLSCLPVDTLVQPLPPSRWRRLNGLTGNATKEQVRQHSYTLLGAAASLSWPQDAHDAHLIAIATRQLLEQQQAAA